MIFRKVALGSTLVCLNVLSGCGKATETTATTTSSSSSLSSTIPTLAVTSPTASRASGSSYYESNLKNPLQWVLRNFLNLSIAEAVPDSEVKPLATLVSELKTDLSSSTPATIAAKIGTLSVISYKANCFGPAWTDDATGTSVNRPPGDLGLVSVQSTPTDTTACSAAQLNSLLGGSPQFLNKLVKLQATMVAAMKKSGKELPAINATVDALTDLPAITGLTISSAKLTRMADTTDGFRVFKTAIAFADASSKAGSATVYHTPKNDDNSNFIGLVQAVLPHIASGSGPGTFRGLSMVYSQTDSVLIYALDTAANRTTNSNDFFNTTTGRVDFSKAAAGEDANRIIASFNTATNATTMHYAWQAGNGDGATRTFAISIAAGTEGSLTGVAYFGYGAAVTALTDTVTSPWMTKMHCNWLNQLSNGPSVNKVQAQTLQQDATKKFVANVSKIDFAPTDNCNKTGSFTITASTDYAGTRTVTAHNLVAVGDLGAIPAVIVPAYNIPTK